MSRAELGWLMRPFAHRGLHDATRGIVENSASAVAAAIAQGFGIEVDLQCCRDRRPVVFHDPALDRLTLESGPVLARDESELTTIALRGSSDRILSLERLLALVAGRVPLLLEVKGTWDDDRRYPSQVAEALRHYPGPVGVMSFDPHCVAAFRELAPALPRGLVADRFTSADWPDMTPLRRFAMRHLLSAAVARPHFIAYDIEGLPAAAPWIARRLFRLPLLTWTVRNEAQKALAERYTDAVIFEGVTP